MIVYHGTTRRAARKIATEGFQPRSGWVWFARGSGYARRRARTKASRARERPVVLTCDIDIDRLRQRYGTRNVRLSGGVVAINGRIPPTALRSHAGVGSPESPDEPARWVNAVLDVKPHRGVSPSHPGIQRLSRWVSNRLASTPNARIFGKELLSYASQWIPEHFERFEVDFEHMRVWPKIARQQEITTRGDDYEPEPEPDHRAVEAQDCLDSEKPHRRLRGLKLLADLEDPDLFDWCALFLGEEDLELTAGTLKVMRRCEDIDPELIAPFADSEDKVIRGAAIEVLGLHGGEGASEWFWKGLTDPEPHVRLSAVKFLDRLDPEANRDVFEAALYDPHPQVAQAAKRLTEGKGFTRLKW